MNKIKIKGVVAGLLSACALGALAVTDAEYNGVKFSTDATHIIAGEWNRNYNEVKARAEEDHAPMIVFWGNNGCGYCEKTESAMAGDYFVTEMQELGAYFVFAIKGDKNAGTQAAAAKNAAIDGSGKFPYIGLYWLKEDGTKVEKKTHGRSGEMPVKKGSLAEQCMGTIKKWINDAGGWSPVKGGLFFASSDAPETEGNRYETEAGRSTVTMLLTRSSSAAKKEFSETIQVKDASGAVKRTDTLSWAADAATKNYVVDVSSLTKAGDKLTVTILNGDKAVQSATITFVEKPNSAANPLWKAERRAPQANGLTKPLQSGEWTMDLETAKKWAAANQGYVLVSVQGSLWCPDCANTDRNFLDVEGTADRDGEKNLVKQWAKKNKVALVSVDIPKLNGAGGADGPLVSFAETAAKAPTLWSRDGMSTTLARSTEAGKSGAPEALQNSLCRSGLGYLSRKGISDEEAAAVLKANWELVARDVSEGGFHERTDTWLNRTGVPIFVLLDSAGRVVARFTEFASSSPMDADKANHALFLKRFDEMIEIAKGTAADDRSEAGNNALNKETAIQLSANGGVQNGCRLAAADVQDVFYLSGMSGNLREKVTVKGSDDTQVTVSIVKAGGFKKTQTSDGATTKKYVLDPVAYKSGVLSGEVSVDCEIKEPGDYFVVVKGDWKGRAASSTSTFCTYTVKAGIDQLLPSEASATAQAPSGSSKIDISLEQGVTYRLVGLGDTVPGLEKVAGSDCLYAYSGTTGKVQLTLESDGGAVTYQKWNPGTVGFEPAFVTLPAKKTTKKAVEVTRKESEGIDIAYRRLGGYSGNVKVRVALNLEKSTFFYDYAVDPAEGKKEIPRFYVNGTTDFLSDTNVAEAVWSDGQDLASCTGSVAVTMRETESEKIQHFFGDGVVVFDIQVVEETEKGACVVDNGSFKVAFTENQKAKPGKVAFAGADREQAKTRTVYVRQSEGVTLYLERRDYSENPAWAEVTRTVSSVKIEAADGLTADWFLSGERLLGWDNHDDARRSLTVTNLPAAGKSVKLGLKAQTKGLSVDSKGKDFTIVSVADDAPAFKNAAELLTVYRYVAVSNHIAVAPHEGALTFKKLSGSLPSGLSVKYDSQAGDLLLTGVPTKTAKSGFVTNAVSYQVIEKRAVPGSKRTQEVAGLTVNLTIVVVDPAVAGTSGTAGVPLNAACKKTRTFTSVPLVDTEDAGLFQLGDAGYSPARRLAGLLTLTLPATGKASAKYTDESGTYSFSAKSWSVLESGKLLGVTLRCTKKGYEAYSVEATIAPDGSLALSLTSGSAEYATTLPASRQWSLQNPATDYEGYYTVSLCNPQLWGEEKFEGLAPRGAGYLTLNLSVDKKLTAKSAASTGTMKWAGQLPNGVKVSGSSVLFAQGEASAYLPYFYVKSGESLYGMAEIAAGVKANLKDVSSCGKSVTLPAVAGDLSYVIPTFWNHVQVAATNTLDWTVAYDVRGSYYDTTLKLLPLDCCCETFHGSTNMLWTAAMPEGASEEYGELGPVSPAEVTVTDTALALKKGASNPQNVTVKFDKKTGVVTGTFSLPVAEGKAQKASYAGVVVVGWGDKCDCSEGPTLPFVTGSWSFSDKAGYELLSRGKVSSKTAKVVRGGYMKIDAPHE